MTDQSAQPTDVYVFYGGVAGRERLRTLSSVMRPFTESFLDALAIDPTWRCLDAGCGGGDVTAELAQRVPRGRVVGLDVDAEQLRLAADELRQAGVDNVELHVADLNSLPSTLAGFDLVYARFVLTHLPAPEAVLAALVDACRPGGVIALEDIDVEASLCDPPTPAFDTYLDWYCRAHRERGGDPVIGRRLVSMLTAAGIDGVDGRVVQPAGTKGDVGLIAPLTAAASSASIVERGIATAAQVEELVRQLAELGGRADTLVTMPRVIQAWGTRP